MLYEQVLSDLADTERLGRQLAKVLFPGAVIALVGPLGAGKTTLTRAIATALGADPKLVASPTFALIHEYPARLPVYHFDTYRLDNVAAFINLGVDEYFQGGGVCLVEWADRVTEALPADHLRIELIPLDHRRRAVITSTGPRHDMIVAELNSV